MAGTIAGGAVWLPFLGRTKDPSLTSWLAQDPGWGWHLLAPIPRMIAALMTMIMVLPVENVPPAIATISILILLTVTGLLGWALSRVFREPSSYASNILWIISNTIAIILLMAGIIYLKGLDLSIAPRYNFILFPLVITLIGYGCSQLWDWHLTHNPPLLPLKPPPLNPPTTFLVNSLNRFKAIERLRPYVWGFNWCQGYRPLIIITLCLGLSGAVTVTMDGAYQKANRADMVADRIVNFAPEVGDRTLIATIHHSHSQTGEMMGLAWEFVHRYPNFKPQFILAHKHAPDLTPALTVAQSLESRSDIEYLWIINFFDDQNPLLNYCHRPTEEKFKASGYVYYPYICHPSP
jgi:uncharacterized membrane protein